MHGVLLGHDPRSCRNAVSDSTRQPRHGLANDDRASWMSGVGSNSYPHNRTDPLFSFHGAIRDGPRSRTFHEYFDAPLRPVLDPGVHGRHQLQSSGKLRPLSTLRVPLHLGLHPDGWYRNLRAREPNMHRPNIFFVRADSRSPRCVRLPRDRGPFICGFCAPWRLSSGLIRLRDVGRAGPIDTLHSPSRSFLSVRHVCVRRRHGSRLRVMHSDVLHDETMEQIPPKHGSTPTLRNRQRIRPSFLHSRLEQNQSVAARIGRRPQIEMDGCKNRLDSLLCGFQFLCYLSRGCKRMGKRIRDRPRKEGDFSSGPASLPREKNETPCEARSSPGCP